MLDSLNTQGIKTEEDKSLSQGKNPLETLKQKKRGYGKDTSRKKNNTERATEKWTERERVHLLFHKLAMKINMYLQSFND